jgi:hypothetical protein
MENKRPQLALRAAFAALIPSGIAFCDGPNGFLAVGKAVDDMCIQLMGVLPVASMLMVIAAGAVYASGQMMGAETRARANTWATAMLVGALIGIIIVTVAPSVLKILYPQQAGNFSCGAQVW